MYFYNNMFKYGQPVKYAATHICSSKLKIINILIDYKLQALEVSSNIQKKKDEDAVSY